jgi:hypothetical protein
MQARDRFGNWQNEGGDPFNATFTDSLGQYAEMLADDYRICPNTTDSDSDSNSTDSDSNAEDGGRRRTLLQQVSFLGDAKRSLGDAKRSLGDAESSLGDTKSFAFDAKSSLGDAKSSLGDAERLAG